MDKATMMRLMAKQKQRPHPVDEAMRQVSDDLDRFDLDSMSAKQDGEHQEPDADDMGGPSDMDADNSPENCEDCKNGTCTKPEHLSDEELAALESMGKD